MHSRRKRNDKNDTSQNEKSSKRSRNHTFRTEETTLFTSNSIYTTFNEQPTCSYTTDSTNQFQETQIRPQTSYDYRINHRRRTHYGQSDLAALNKRRAFQYVQGLIEPHDRKFQFRIGSYNLLAPGLASEHSELYRSVNPSFMDWNYRKRKILAEIRTYHADIYCFQEMQEDQYLDFFLPELNKSGYNSVYKKRHGDKIDGCCVCYKRSKFTLVEQDLVDFHVPDVPLLDRDNVGIILLLKPTNQKKYKKKYLCVANTHILYNPKRGDCKLAQLMFFLARIERMAFRELILNEKKSSYHPTIMCGDFNLDFRSKLYEFIRASKLEDYKNLNRALISGQLETCASNTSIGAALLPQHLGITDRCQFRPENETRHSQQREDIFGGDTLSHPFSFESVYKHYDRLKNSCEVTTCHYDNKRTVDYMFYHSEINKENDSEMNLVARLELFNEVQLRSFFLPSRYYPSDHFMIMAKFAIE